MATDPVPPRSTASLITRQASNSPRHHAGHRPMASTASADDIGLTRHTRVRS
jgi:hypothetical protein